jgi:hypothetical protein
MPACGGFLLGLRFDPKDGGDMFIKLRSLLSFTALAAFHSDFTLGNIIQLYVKPRSNCGLMCYADLNAYSRAINMPN